MRLFPNPARDVLHVDGVSLNTRYEIVNLMGQKMDEGEAQKTIDISMLLPGMYFKELTDENGDRKTMKFVMM